MKLIILNKAVIVGKDKREWVKLSALSAKGKASEPFLSKAVYDSMNVDESQFLTPAELAEIFSTYKSVEVSYDDASRIESIG